MSRIVFSEQQSFRQTAWIWIIILPVALGSSLLMVYGFYQQVILGDPWGNKPMSDAALTAVTAGVVLTEGLVIAFVSSMQVSVEVTSQEFRYRFFSFTGWNTLSRREIESYTISNYSFLDARGWGYRKDRRTKTVCMIITSDYVLTLKLTDGRTIMMSTCNKEEMERAMRRLMSDSENL